MIDYKHKDLFTKSHVDKQIRIATDDGLFVATNEDIHFEDFELSESLCSDSELRFGSCEASMVKFQIRNAFIPLAGKWMTITETLDGNTDVPFKYGRYKVFSDVPTADKEYRDIIAYDSMYDILNADVSVWYNTILQKKDSKVTMKRFRESFMRHFGLTEIIPQGGLANDNMIVEKTIDPEEISGKDVITAICEINGCFGRIGRDGKFHYIYLLQNIQGLYPADFLFPDRVPDQWDYLPQAETGHLYPQDPKGTGLGTGRYIRCEYQDYIVRQINKLQIRQEENDIGAVYPNTKPIEKDNCYIIEDNFLVYGMGAAELNTVAENIYNRITGIVYRPFSGNFVGNPCTEVGDPIRIQTKYHIVESYIFERRLKGIQGPRDFFSSSGEEKRKQKINATQKSIIRLKGKTNILTRNIEETRQEMKDADEQLSSTISQTAAQIRLEVARTAEGLSSRIEQNAGSISAEVSRATEAEGKLSSRIDLNEEGISLRVKKGDVSSEISQEAGAIDIRANRLTISSDNFSLSSDGRISARNASISGNIDADGGIFNNVTIRGNCIVAGQSITGMIGSGYGGVSWGGDTIGGGYIGDGINGSYVGTGISGSNITSGTVGNSRITSSLVDKSFENNVGGQPITLKGSGGTTWIGSTGASFASGKATIGMSGIAGPSLAISGQKNRVVNTKNYGKRLLCCYETPTPMFGDIGEGETDKTGTCMIFLDDIFAETIDLDCMYQVFLQAYGSGNCYVSERTPSYFIVKGDVFLKFGWEIKAIQKGYDTMRLEIEEDHGYEEVDVLDGLSSYMDGLLYDAEKESEEIL